MASKSFFPKPRYGSLDDSIGFTDQYSIGSTSEALGAGAKSALMSSYDVGTGIREFKAGPLAINSIREQAMSGGKIGRLDTEEDVAARGDNLIADETEMKASRWYREDSVFEPGLTESRLRAITEMNIEEDKRNIAMEGRFVSSLIGGLGGSLASPLNYIPGPGELSLGANAVKSISLAKRMIQSGISVSAATAVGGILTARQREKLGDDVSFNAQVTEASIGFLIGNTFGAVVHGGSKIFSGGTRRSNAAVDSALNTLADIDKQADAAYVFDDAMTSYLHSNGEDITFTPQSQRIFDQSSQAAATSIETNWPKLIFNEDNTVNQKAVAGFVDNPIVRERTKNSVVKYPGGEPITVFSASGFGDNTKYELEYRAKKGFTSQSAGAGWFSGSPKSAFGYALLNYADTKGPHWSQIASIEAKKTYDAILLNKEATKVEIAEAKLEYDNALITEKAKMDAQVAPNIRPAVLNITNPMTIDMKGKGWTLKDATAAVKAAKKAGHDGLIVSNILDAPALKPVDGIKPGEVQTPDTHYAVFNADSVVDTVDATIESINLRNAELKAFSESKVAEYKARKNKQVKFDKTSFTTKYEEGVTSGVYEQIDVSKLLKITDDAKLKEESLSLSGMDLKAKTTGFEDDYNSAIEQDPLAPAEHAALKQVELDLIKADAIEEIVAIGAKCIS